MQNFHIFSSFNKTEKKTVVNFLSSFWIPTVGQIKHIKI